MKLNINLRSVWKKVLETTVPPSTPTAIVVHNGCHYSVTSFNKTWTQVLCRCKSCSWQLSWLELSLNCSIGHSFRESNSSSYVNISPFVIAYLLWLYIASNLIFFIRRLIPKTLKYWVGVQQGQSYLMERRCLFSLGWPTESGFIVRSVETGRWTLVVAVISVDAYPFFGFLRPGMSPWGYRNRCFLITLHHLIVRRPNLEIVTKRLLHQQVKIPGQF